MIHFFFFFFFFFLDIHIILDIIIIFYDYKIIFAKYLCNYACILQNLHISSEQNLTI